MAGRRLLGRNLGDRVVAAAGMAALAFGLITLGVLLADVLADGLTRLSWSFLTSYPSRRPADAGIYPALVGSVFLIGLTALLAIPVGIAAAVYLEEYGRGTRVERLIEINIANLAGVPSIIYGLLGLGVFVRTFGLGRSLLAGAATLALLVLPVVILTTREALRAVPKSLREGSYALAATRWQTIWYQVLPVALPNILTGLILALSRAIGETAPLITIGALTYVPFLPGKRVVSLDLGAMIAGSRFRGETAPLITIGALTYVPFLPDSIWSAFTVLPIQTFNWISRPQADFARNAAAAIVVLLVVLFVMNGLAVWLRDRYQRRRA